MHWLRQKNPWLSAYEISLAKVEECAQFCETLAKDVIFPKRLGNAEEFAQYAVQIVENQYINGSVLRLDGGIRLA